mmetsp:Transcript_22541/g.37281  ORF Transcript_22541/g.37281 Transcript_22541/m.37281 type:complete len:119 (-) Transcript_22541:62-418(-)
MKLLARNVDVQYKTDDDPMSHVQALRSLLYNSVNLQIIVKDSDSNTNTSNTSNTSNTTYNPQHQQLSLKLFECMPLPLPLPWPWPWPPALPCPVLLCPALSCPALPCPALPCLAYNSY